MPKFALSSTVRISYILNIIKKIEFMGSTLLQCDTLVAVASRAVGPPLTR